MDAQETSRLAAVKLAFELVDGQARMASLLDLCKQNVWFWLQPGRTVPEDHCPRIELLTRGQVLCEQLRNDVAWGRIPDPNWPWHPQGRPVIEITRSEKFSSWRAGHEQKAAA